MATTRTSTIRKVIGSLGVIGTAAAVAGLGTFGTFTDSTTPISTRVDAGTVDINLASGPVAFPVTTAGFVPGDFLSRAVTLTNDGTAPLSTVALGVTATASSILDTDPTHGLQLSLQSCSVPWTQAGSSAAPTYTCSGTAATLADGPVTGDRTLAGLASVAPGATDHLVVTISLPTSAGNQFQGTSSSLALTFTGVQRNGGAR